MVQSGDNIEIRSQKTGNPPRRGVVTGMSGRLLRIRWEDGEESSLVPGPGTLNVLGRQKKANRKKPTRKKANRKKPSKPSSKVKSKPKGRSRSRKSSRTR